MPNRINRPRIVNTLKMLTSSANLPLDVILFNLNKKR